MEKNVAMLVFLLEVGKQAQMFGPGRVIGMPNEADDFESLDAASSHTRGLPFPIGFILLALITDPLTKR